MKQVYGFAFGGRNISAYALWRLKGVNCCYQIFSNNLENYLEFLLHDQPAFVLGLGVWTGSDQGLARIEKFCTNQFRNSLFEGDKPVEVSLNPFLKPSLGSKYAEAMGNSWCNLISWKIMQLINSGRLKSRYAFLHLPRRLRVRQAVAEIDALLAELKSLQYEPNTLLFSTS